MASNSETGIDRKRRLDYERQIMLEEIKRQKDAIQQESARDRTSASRFTGKTESLEDTLKVETVGLVKLEEFREKRKELEDRVAREKARTSELKAEEVRRKKEKRKKKSTLSFGFEAEDGGADESGQTTPQDAESPAPAAADSPGPAKRAKIGKNPHVDTTYLPDREREEAERRQREEIRQDWLRQQEEAKVEIIDVVFAYWDGHGHRSEVKCKKGDTISQFLERARSQFSELSRVSIDNLMYIKEDLIIPHHYTFYDFIINKTRGKSGPLFDFSEREDVRVLHDATVEKDESHAGKVVERNWYNRNKHIFPASRWEPFDPEKDYGAYRIRG